MTFFESLILLLLVAIILLQIARRLSLPYPAMLAGAGVFVALIPGSPNILLAPDTALALFIAPVLVDSAFDYPLVAARRFWAPLVSLVIFAVLITTGVVAWIGVAYIGLPLAAAVALGAIVSPPDAAAATAVLTAVSIPRSTEAVLKGESLFNDASALLLFTAAVSVQSDGGLTPAVDLQLALAIPGGILFGIVCAFWVRRINRVVVDSLGGNILQFVLAYLVWIAAERLHLSAILCIIAFAMTLARSSGTGMSARMRVQSYAVWSSVVFTLNVLAFLLMGMQARNIVSRMDPTRLRESFATAAFVISAVVITRMIVIIAFNRIVAWHRSRKGLGEGATIRQAIFVGWCGMRGFVTLATAFALPQSFPQRDLVVLVAFSVVLATLVVQGLTLAPLIRLLKLNDRATAKVELAEARVTLAQAALAALGDKQGQEVDLLRDGFSVKRDAATDRARCESLERYRALGLEAVSAEREALERLRTEDRVGVDTYLLLQEELDWSELTLLPEDDRRIVET
ncbi:MAG: cation:proton antiporter [Bryobacteraceae bacterium]